MSQSAISKGPTAALMAATRELLPKEGVWPSPAAVQAALRAMEEALGNGADPQVRSQRVGTPLDLAVEADCLPAVNLLLQAGASPTDADGHRRTAFLLACLHGSQTAILQQLVQAGADVHHTDRRSRTALHYAVIGEHVATVRFLLEAGVDPTRVDATGNQAMNYARRAGEAWRARDLCALLASFTAQRAVSAVLAGEEQCP